MRKKFILFILIPLLILLVVTYLFIDRWIESGLESAGENIVGARVEIDNLSLGISPLGIRFDRLQVANPRDPWKNLFETGRVAFAMNFGQLLRGKTIVNLFLEPSTRTRMAFTMAAKRLSADVISFDSASSSTTKGETLRDTAQNIQALQADMIVIRHAAAGSPLEPGRACRLWLDRINVSLPPPTSPQ